MIKPKLTLDDLQVESFITSLDAQELQAEGGTTPACGVSAATSIAVTVASVVTTIVTSIAWTLSKFHCVAEIEDQQF